MNYKDYDESKPPYMEFANDDASIYPILEAFAPNKDHDALYKLNAIYRWSENLMANASSQAVCKSGCFHCCAQKVAVKPIELDNIRTNIGDFQARDNGRFCPLLDIEKGACGIYEVRPLVCRAMLTFDNPKYCERGERHWIFDFKQLNPVMNQVLVDHELGEYLASNIEQIMLGEEVDLREEFQP
jgi:Fe-S-cluster containining protein